MSKPQAGGAIARYLTMLEIGQELADKYGASGPEAYAEFAEAWHIPSPALQRKPKDRNAAEEQQARREKELAEGTRERIKREVLPRLLEAAQQGALIPRDPVTKLPRSGRTVLDAYDVFSAA